MEHLPWKKILLCILIITIIIGISACQSKLGKGIGNFFDTLSQMPDHVGDIFTKIMGGLSDIGAALAEQVNRIIGNMTNR